MTIHKSFQNINTLSCRCGKISKWQKQGNGLAINVRKHQFCLHILTTYTTQIYF